MKYTSPLQLPMNLCAIYQIIRKGEESWEGDDLGDRYIGSAKNVRKRLQKHYSALQNNSHYNKHLQSAWNKYGKNSFYISIIQKVNEKCRFEIEELQMKVAKCTYNLYNIADKCIFVKLSQEQIEKARNKKFKPVVCLNIDGSFYKEYKGIMQAANEFGGTTTNISKVCKSLIDNEFKYSCNDKLFCYKKDYDSNIKYNYRKNWKMDIEKVSKRYDNPVLQYDLNWNFIKEWINPTTASRAMGIHDSSIGAVCNDYKNKRGKNTISAGYKWVYKYPNENHKK